MYIPARHSAQSPVADQVKALYSVVLSVSTC